MNRARVFQTGLLGCVDSLSGRMALIGRLDAFDPDVEEWPNYVERVEGFFLANDVAADKRVPALLCAMGGKAYALLKSLLAPVPPGNATFENISATLQAHFAPRPLVIAERFKFHKRLQQTDEGVNQYVVELRRLAERCDFGQVLEETIRDQLVCGLANGAIQRRLLTEDNLTLLRAVQIAVGMETAAKDASELRPPPPVVNRMQAQAQPRRSGSRCYRCGKGNHTPEECRFKDQTCHRCHIRGHIRAVCRSSTDGSPRRGGRGKAGAVRTLREEQNSDSEEVDEGDDDLHLMVSHMQVNHLTNNQAIWVYPTVDGKVVKMELDTGSAVSIIGTEEFSRLFPDRHLEHSLLRLRTYTGEEVTPEGVTKVTVKYEGGKHDLDLYVVANKGPGLFGRDWLRKIKLDWGSIKSIHGLPDTANGLSGLLQKYGELFDTGKAGKLKDIQTRLSVTPSCKPRFLKARQVPYSLRPAVDKELQRLEEDKIITPVRYSEWATPIVPVVKGNGRVRLCGDFKTTINPVLLVDKYPLPRIVDIFANLSGGVKFSKVDLTDAFLQMEVEEQSRKYLTINTQRGLYEYTRLPFGVASAPAIWQRTMDQILGGIPRAQCILDDILVTGRNDEEHLANLERVLARLAEFGLRVNETKCRFFQNAVEYCGHVIDANGLHKSQAKVEAIWNAPPPRDVSQVRSFIGMINYYARFLPNLSTMLRPLHELLQANRKFYWSGDCQEAFRRAKAEIASERVLTHYNPMLPVKVACDASDYGLGAVMSHVMPGGAERPVAFASRTLSKAEANYAQIDKEALGIVWGVQKFHQYLHGRHFTIVTDHKPLQAIFHPQKGIPVMAAKRIQHWALFLAGHTYDIEYKKGTEHTNADGLSRLPLVVPDEGELDEVDLFNMSQVDVLPVTCEQIGHYTKKDPTLSLVYEAIRRGWTTDPGESLKPFYIRRDELTLLQGCILWGIRVVIPKKLRGQVMEELHSGHLGVVKMKAVARSQVWWPGMDHDIEVLARECSGCHQVMNNPAGAPLHPWEHATAPWQRIHVDFAGPFLGKMFIIIVDAYSKWPEILPMVSTSSESTIEVLRSLFAMYGVAEELVSDNGPQFTSDGFETFLKSNGIRHARSAPYHPATNGLAERMVQTFKQSMKAMKQESGSMNKKASEFPTGLPYSAALNHQ